MTTPQLQSVTMDGAKLFSDVRFVLAECINPGEVKTLLLDGGAKHINYLSDIVTHVIADRDCSEAEEAIELFDKPVVSSMWVHLCLKARAILPPEAFNPLRRLFNGTIAAFSRDMSQKDCEILAALVTFHGGNVSKSISSSTHLIATSAKPSDLSDNQYINLKVVAPDWILDSVEQKSRCDEVNYDPSFLSGPPPPTPPAPLTPPIVQHTILHGKKEKPANTESAPQSEISEKDKDLDDSIYRPESHNIISEQVNRKIDPQAQNSSPQRLINPQLSQRPVGQLQQQQSQQIHPQPQMHMGSQLPRPRFNTNMIGRAPQPRFRPIIQTNVNLPRQQMQMPQPINRPPGTEQSKVNIDYNNSFRKMGPYQNGPEILHMPQPTSGPPSYRNVQHVPMQQQHQGSMMGQHPPSRIPQPGVYHQQRGPYIGNQMQPRINQPQQNDRFSDLNGQTQQRSYQVYAQPQQAIGPNYQQGPVNRHPSYYGPGHQNQMPLRQQSPVNRPMIQGQPNFQENYHGQPHQAQHENVPIQQNQQQYQPAYQHQSHQPSHISPHQQHHPQQLQQQSQTITQQGAQFSHPHQGQMIIRPRQQQPQPNLHTGATLGVPSPRLIQPNHSHPHESKQIVVRQPNPQFTNEYTTASQQERPTRTPLVQPQPHPSIFDIKQESNLAQLRAKVPSLTDNVNYFGYDPTYKPPKDMPLSGCRFKMIEYEGVSPDDRELYTTAIEEAGGTFIDEEDQLTHLLCETRLTKQYSEALKKGIRCITVYWVNDVLARDENSFPWKALHLPKWFDLRDKPLKDQMISITNIKGRERRETIEMLIQAGAMYTDSFCQKNTLLICGSPGGEKYERAIVWRIPIVNCQIIVDYILGEEKDFSKLLSLAKYQNFTKSDLLKIGSYRKIRDVMEPWTKPTPAPGSSPISGSQNQKDSEGIALTNGSTKENELPPNLQSSEDSGVITSGSNNSDSDGTSKSATSMPIINSNQPISAEKNASEVQAGANTEVTKSVSDKIDASIQSAPTDSVVNKSPVEDATRESKNNVNDEAVKAYSTAIKDTALTSESTTSVHMLAVSLKPENHEVEEDKFVDCRETQSSDIACNSEGTVNPKLDTQAVSEIENTKPIRKSTEPVRILFTRLDRKLVKELQSYALDLQLGLANSPNDCTHLVVDRLCRTPKFICALNNARFVVDYKWLIESHRIKQVIDEKAFILQDSEGEEKFSFSLVRSLLKRKKRADRPLFNNMVFFVTPAILSKVANLKEMIESAGGTMITRKLPTQVQLNQMKMNGKKFVVVTNQLEYHLVSSIKASVDIVGSEFIISGILRQDIDFEAHRIRFRNNLSTGSAQKASALIQPSPSKRSRID